MLHWLRKDPALLKGFESHRVGEIQDLCRSVEWRHVKTEHNPADALSRGQLPQEFLDNNTWFQGPTWLKQSERVCPKSDLYPVQEMPGLKKITCLSTSIDSQEIFSRFFSCLKMI